MLLEVIAQIITFIRQNPSFWKEVIFVREYFIHAHQVASKHILAGDALNAWKHVDFLPRMKFRQEVGSNRQVMPRQIIHRRQFLAFLLVSNGSFVIFLEILQFPIAHFFRNFLDHVILRLANVDHKPMLGVSS